MADFSYEALNNQGQHVSGTITAGNRAEAVKNLRDQGTFETFLNDYYADGSTFNQFFSKTMLPIVRSMSEGVQNTVTEQLNKSVETDPTTFQNEYVDNLTFRYTSSSRRQLQKLLTDLPEDEDASEVIDTRINEWEDGSTPENPSRAQKESTNESHRFVQAAARMFFTAGGVSQLVWNADGEACPICDELNGRVVGVEDAFVEDGDDLRNGYKAEGRFMNPPLHQNCTCSVDPA